MLHQVLLIEDSGGAAQVISELVMPLLKEAENLPVENFVRQNKIEERGTPPLILATNTHLDKGLIQSVPVDAVKEYEDGYHLDRHLKGAEFLTSRDKSKKEVWQSIINICTHLELLTTFCFRTKEANTADRKLGSVQRRFHEVGVMSTFRLRSTTPKILY